MKNSLKKIGGLSLKRLYDKPEVLPVEVLTEGMLLADSVTDLTLAPMKVAVDPYDIGFPDTSGENDEGFDVEF